METCTSRLDRRRIVERSARLLARRTTSDTVRVMELRRHDGYLVSDDVSLLDRERVWRWIAEESYWAVGRARNIQDRALENSLCIGLYAPDGMQVGFCRFVTDRATFAFLSDVFVDETHRGTGAGTFMVEFAVAHPELADVRQQTLRTRDAHGLYARFGYRALDANERQSWMIRIGVEQ